MIKLIIYLVGSVILLVGIISIFNARSLTKKLFSFGDQNEATAGLKILGFIISIIGLLIVFFNK